MVLAGITIGLLIVSWLLRPRWWGNTRVQAMSITVLGGVAMVVVTDQLWLASLTAFYERLQGAFPEALPVIHFPDVLTFNHRLGALIVLGILFIILNIIWSRHNTLPPPKAASPSQTPFVEKGYEQLRDEFCEYMLRQLDQYDTDLSWSDSDYTNLEAEVEMDRRGAVKRDLVRTIRRDRNTRAFLLLGDPGSGKSVSLRRLCRQLYSEVKDTGVVPVYVNLREWDGPSNPSDSEISEFIRRHLKRASGRAGKRFLDQWYEPMLADGRFFFLLDSFDEMPAVLDCDDASPRIKEISRAFDRFFQDFHQCRGVLASRRFRQPRGFHGRRMTVRPLKESQIRQAMSHWLTVSHLDPATIVRDLFSNRPELVPIFRNPFLADLTTQYLIHNNGELPPNQFAIYDAYITQRLTEDEVELRALKIEKSELLDAAAQIARAMYDDPEIGLEINVSQLAEWLEVENLEDLVYALRLTRLIRIGGEESKRLSFVHRRFAEFFIVRSLIKRDQEIPIASLPEDSRWRDCFIAYCSVAPIERVKAIADLYWQFIQQRSAHVDNNNTLELRPTVQCLRFLRDAFMARQDPLDNFRFDLEVLILNWVNSQDILKAKFATEILGLLSPQKRSLGIAAAFNQPGAWVRETALLSCRHLPSIDKEARDAIRIHIKSLTTFRLLNGYRDLAFSLSLSESLKEQLRAVRLDLLWLCLLWLLAPWFFKASVNLFLESPFWLTTTILLAISFLLEGLVATTGRRISAVRFGLDDSVRLTALSIPLIYLFAGSEFGMAPPREPIRYWLVFLFLLIYRWELIPLLTRKSTLSTISDYILFGLVWTGILVNLTLATKSLGFNIEVESYINELTFSATAFILILSLSLSLLMGYDHIRDHLKLLQIDNSHTVSYRWIYQASAKLRTSRARGKFLDTLRLRDVVVTGEPIPLPDEKWADDRVREGMARLESMWMGLDE